MRGWSEGGGEKGTLLLQLLLLATVGWGQARTLSRTPPPPLRTLLLVIVWVALQPVCPLRRRQLHLCKALGALGGVHRGQRRVRVGGSWDELLLPCSSGWVGGWVS